MQPITRIQTITIAALLLSPIQMLQAQTIDPVGHYEGSISSPAGEMSLQIDLTKTAKGEMAGTLTVPAQKLTGFPLTNVIVKGNDVSFDIATSGGGYFRGELTEKRISGEFSMPMGPFPLDLERAGEARTYPLPASARIGKELEGVWKGTLDVDGGMRVSVNLANQADGTSSGNFVSVDENNLTVPVAIAQDGTKVTLMLPMVGSSYVGTVNAAGTEVSGTYTTSRGLAMPLSLKRAATN
jgi:hypothetical protein